MTILTRQPAALDLLARQPATRDLLARQPVRMAYAQNPRWTDGGSAPFDPSTYGTVISAHTARGLGLSNGASVPSLTGYGPAERVITAPSGSAEATYNSADQTMDYDGNDYYEAASRTPYDTLHQGPAGTVVVRFALDSATSGDAHILFATATESGSNVGVTAYIDDRSSRSNRMMLAVSGGTSIYSADDPAASLTLVGGVHVILAYAWDATDARLYQDATLLLTEAASGDSPSAATSDTIPTFGAGPASRFDIDTGSVSDYLIYSDKLDATDVAALVTALEAEYD